jgi:hypothetical protein
LKISQDKDIITQPSASYQDIYEYEEEIGDGPDIDCLIFDMKGPLDSRWNIEALRLLRQGFEQAIQAKELRVAGCADQSTLYWQDAFTERLKRLRNEWKNGQFQMKASGERETEDEWRERITQERELALKKARHLTRRRAVRVGLISKIKHRLTIVSRGGSVT